MDWHARNCLGADYGKATRQYTSLQPSNMYALPDNNGENDRQGDKAARLQGCKAHPTDR